jgi:DNA replication and repair protein RecF
MRVTRLRLTDFRSYTAADVRLGPGLNIVHGPNAVGKTNLLEALYFGCTGRSCRTSNERELVRFGASATHVAVDTLASDGPHSLSVGLAPGQPKRMLGDGAALEGLADHPGRPLVGVFLPERLELVKGPPGLRRSHMDSLVAAMWPARATIRRSYSQALAQRNALLLRIRAGRASATSLPAWDLELAQHGVALSRARAEAAERLREPFAERAGQLGLAGATTLAYRPRSRAGSPEELAEELEARRTGDLERGFTTHGPHRDELALTREGRELRAFGSQGEHRLALLALLLAERDALAQARTVPPLLLLDDVMSELDPGRRERLAGELSGAGQCLLTTTDLGHVPGASGRDVTRLAVRDGAVLQEARAA